MEYGNWQQMHAQYVQEQHLQFRGCCETTSIQRHHPKSKGGDKYGLGKANEGTADPGHVEAGLIAGDSWGTPVGPHDSPMHS